MARTGTRARFKVSTLKQQRENAELELIIDEFGRAMRNANPEYVARNTTDAKPNFTLNMTFAWDKYLIFCVRSLKNGKK